MQAQIDFANGEQFDNLRRALFSLEEAVQIVHGVTIEFHPTWWRLQAWHRSTGLSDDWLFREFGFNFHTWNLGAPFRPDPAWSTEFWRHICQREDRDEFPFLIKICTVPTPFGDSRRKRLEAFARDTERHRLFCQVEARPVARAAGKLGGGDTIRLPNKGTLGGVLKDQSSRIERYFGLTCAHVAPNVGATVQIKPAKGGLITDAGQVTHTTYGSLTPLPGGTPCNRSPAPSASAIDIALIELSTKHSNSADIPQVGKVDAVLAQSDFGSGDAVRMHGAASGFNHYYIGAYAAMYKVLFDDLQSRCFDHMFEICGNSATTFPTWLAPLAKSGHAISGDSGAWVCADSPSGNAGFCGTLVAVDGTRGYAAFADAAVGWAMNHHGLDLVPV